VDFTDLNDACPKDYFPLPRIDTLIDATAEHEMLSFTDGFSGYNQIKMHKDDIPKVTFITDFGVYCYLVMVFGVQRRFFPGSTIRGYGQQYVDGPPLPGTSARPARDRCTAGFYKVIERPAIAAPTLTRAAKSADEKKQLENAGDP